MQGEPRIVIVGLGYVGLPLAAAFGRTGWTTYGFDVNAKRIEELKGGRDRTRELTEEELASTTIVFSDDPSVIAEANTVIVAVPTPVDKTNVPDLSLVKSATQTIGAHMKEGTVVIYESTVYPGVTEEICLPILEKESGLKAGEGFTVGYSPERINPGDKEHTIDKIVKVIAGQDEATCAWMEKVYGKIVAAGTFRAATIKTAELAKALENTQRDLNIALMNEVARLCDRLGIRTADVLDAAGTKWNFLRFSPGLVGGHCIGVDPYYLVHKAKELGMHTEVISAGRKMNDTQTSFVEKQILRAMAESDIAPKGARVLVMGLTFKENVPDTRNAKVHDLIRKLQADGCNVFGHDPLLNTEEITALGITAGSLEEGPYDVIVHAVTHKAYEELTPSTITKALGTNGILYDVKSRWKPGEIPDHVTYLSL